ncbi:MAG: 16S rRNA (adenine(1518)-N(6)/adenine(1519)-N(6))-dimethyltransferase RsmA [Parcubacteria group bacterium]|jgi:16S rRNA (adenine1518-N6/adenine1519-N6)-dimethyltransferase
MPTKLGQNFLTDEATARKIIESSSLSPSDNVLEIGPGEGILTNYLAKAAGRIFAVEIDKKLADSLKKKTGDTNLEIIEGDILKINLPELLEENAFNNYKVIANLPYYITSKIIRLLLETKYPPTEMVLMVQKEVGERICAPIGQESILSISVKFYAEPEILFFVAKEKFDPVPKVDSAVIKIKKKNKIPDVDAGQFFSLVRAGFCSRRKMLLNNLSTSFHIPKAELSETLKKAGIDPAKRAQELEFEDWLKLYLQLKTKSEKLKTTTKTRRL